MFALKGGKRRRRTCEFEILKAQIYPNAFSKTFVTFSNDNTKRT